MKKQWQVLEPNQKTIDALSRQMGCSPLFARLLAIRGIRSNGSGHPFSKSDARTA
jgi:hypothetical protein